MKDAITPAVLMGMSATMMKSLWFEIHDPKIDSRFPQAGAADDSRALPIERLIENPIQ